MFTALAREKLTGKFNEVYSRESVVLARGMKRT